MTSWVGPAAAFGSSVTWAVGSTGYSRLSRGYSAFAVNFARAMVAFPLFVIAAFVSAGGWSAGLHDFSALRLSHFGWFSLSMISSYALGDVLFLWSTRHLGIPGALAIASCYPIWTALIGAAQGDILVPKQWLGLFLTVLGVVSVILSGARKGAAPRTDGTHLWKGVGLAFSSSLLWALNSYSVSQGGRDLSAPVGNVVRMGLALFLTWSMGRIFHRKESILLSRAQMRRSFPLFVFEAFGGSYFYVYGLAHSPLAIGSALASLAPALSVPVAWGLGLEKFSVFRTLGVFCVVLGVCYLVLAF